MKSIARLGLAVAVAWSTVPTGDHVASAQTAPATVQKMTAEQAREENAYAVGLQAFLWGYPLRFYGTILPPALEADGTRINELRKFPALKTAQDRFVVTPNNVTIDAYAAFDVTDEPTVIFVPPVEGDRWYLVQIGDHFDEIVHNIGGTKGPQPGVYVITGPDFTGTLPGEMTEIRSRTRYGVVDVRILAKGEADLPAAVEAHEASA
jgi:hypothetical protein